MELLRAKILFHCFLFLLLCACPARTQDHDQYGFSYDDRNPSGPSHWGKIKPEWRTCSTGKMQSPVDVSDCRAVVAPKLGSLKRNYKPSNATLVNRGFQMALEWKEGGGNTYVDGIMYKLKGCHWHVPSEHLINGKRFDLEIHLVHESINGNLTVVAMVYKIGSPEPFLSKMQHYIKELAHKIDEERVIGYVDPNRINTGKAGKYYRYIGSLTIPPCSENLVWTVMGEVRTVSREQVELIRKALVDEPKRNARPVQPLNNRLVKMHTPRALTI